MKMKNILTMSVLAIALNACVQLPAPVVQPNTSGNAAPDFSGLTRYGNEVSASNFKLAANHWTNVAKIRAEADRLGAQVRANKITKVQAAQYLNRFRLNLVGSNQIDDSVYEVYLRAAVDSQRGVIDAAQSKSQVESTLKGWQQRWGNMSNRPNNPAFTNFLLEYMNMQPLK